MRGKCFLISLIFGAATGLVIPAPATAQVFGSVVPIGGSASDIALDESRGLLYIANFGAHSIDVMSTATNTIQSSINVGPWPGALALSADGQYLLVAQYCNVLPTGGPTSPPCTNAITSIHLADGSQQVFPLASPPLGVAFQGSSRALVVTTTNFLLLDPVYGDTQLVYTFGTAIPGGVLP